MGCTYSIEDRITAQHHYIAQLHRDFRHRTPGPCSCFPPDEHVLDAAYKELERLEELSGREPRRTLSD
jgi:hypothetical protein